jgi:hypothetical protein
VGHTFNEHIRDWPAIVTAHSGSDDTFTPIYLFGVRYSDGHLLQAIKDDEAWGEFEDIHDFFTADASSGVVAAASQTGQMDLFLVDDTTTLWHWEVSVLGLPNVPSSLSAPDSGDITTTPSPFDGWTGASLAAAWDRTEGFAILGGEQPTGDEELTQDAAVIATGGILNLVLVKEPQSDWRGMSVASDPADPGFNNPAYPSFMALGPTAVAIAFGNTGNVEGRHTRSQIFAIGHNNIFNTSLAPLPDSGNSGNLPGEGSLSTNLSGDAQDLIS